MILFSQLLNEAPQVIGITLEYLVNGIEPPVYPNPKSFPAPDLGLRSFALSQLSDLRPTILSALDTNIVSQWYPPELNITSLDIAEVAYDGWKLYEAAQRVHQSHGANSKLNSTTTASKAIEAVHKDGERASLFLSKFLQVSEAVVLAANGQTLRSLMLVGPAIGEVRWMGQAAFSRSASGGAGASFSSGKAASSTASASATMLGGGQGSSSFKTSSTTTNEDDDTLRPSKESLDPTGALPGIILPFLGEAIFAALVFFSTIGVLVAGEDGEFEEPSVQIHLAYLMGTENLLKMRRKEKKEGKARQKLLLNKEDKVEVVEKQETQQEQQEQQHETVERPASISTTASATAIAAAITIETATSTGTSTSTSTTTTTATPAAPKPTPTPTEWSSYVISDPLHASIKLNVTILVVRVFWTQILNALLLPSEARLLKGLMPILAFITTIAPAVPPIVTVGIPSFLLTFLFHGAPLRGTGLLLGHLYMSTVVEGQMMEEGMGTDGIAILDAFSIWMGWFRFGGVGGLVVGPFGFLSVRRIAKGIKEVHGELWGVV
jgi:hypothetical protein